MKVSILIVLCLNLIADGSDVPSLFQIGKPAKFSSPSNDQTKLPNLLKRKTCNPKYVSLDASGAILSKGSSTISSSILNLAKTILGAGILSLPYGVAAFSDSPSVLLPSSILLLIMGAMSAYSFSSIGKACEVHGVKSFSDAWAKSVDGKTAPFISFIITFKTFFACLAYSIIIGKNL